MTNGFTTLPHALYEGARLEIRPLTKRVVLIAITYSALADVHAINTGLYSVLIAKFTGAGMIAPSSRLVSERISKPRAFAQLVATSVRLA